jgi:hypothetical protein
VPVRPLLFPGGLCLLSALAFASLGLSSWFACGQSKVFRTMNAVMPPM